MDERLAQISDGCDFKSCTLPSYGGFSLSRRNLWPEERSGVSQEGRGGGLEGEEGTEAILVWVQIFAKVPRGHGGWRKGCMCKQHGGACLKLSLSLAAR